MIVIRRERVIFHIDVNSAYLSWEAIELLKEGYEIDVREVPSVVGGDESKRRGIVLAKSYPAIKYGIQTGMSLREAKSLYPDLLVVPARGHIYSKKSKEMFKLLSEYSDRVQKYSIDEGFVDFTGMQKILGNPIDVANEIRERIYNEMGFTVCVGVSSNKVLAKMATELRKPNFTNTLFVDEIEQKLWGLPINDLFYVGKQTAIKLNRLGFNKIGDIAKADVKFLETILKSHGRQIWEYANGIDLSEVRAYEREEKSIGHSTTVAYNIDDINAIFPIYLKLVEKVCTRLRKAKKTCQVIHIHYKTSDFKVYGKQMKIGFETNNTTEIFEISKKLFIELWKGEKIRLVGISVSDLKKEEERQLTLFDDVIDEKRQLDKMVDDIRYKYGKNAIVRATNLNMKTSEHKEFLQTLSIKY